MPVFKEIDAISLVKQVPHFFCFGFIFLAFKCSYKFCILKCNITRNLIYPTEPQSQNNWTSIFIAGRMNFGFSQSEIQAMKHLGQPVYTCLYQ